MTNKRGSRTEALTVLIGMAMTMLSAAASAQSISSNEQIRASDLTENRVTLSQENSGAETSLFLTGKDLQVRKVLKQQRLNHWHIPAANYSGITRLNGDDYAVCDDKSEFDGFTILTISQDPRTGRIIDTKRREPRVYQQRRKEGKYRYRDCEGIAFCPERNSVFVSGEEDQRIVEYSLDGEPTGQELQVPECFSKANIRPNYGFEALTYNSRTGLFWTTTESTLKQDGESASLSRKNVANKLRLQSFGTDLKAREQYTYTMDLPTVRKSQGTYVHGVPSLLALDDGSLIVMEREEYVPHGYLGAFCKIKLYVVDPTRASEKRLLTKFTTHLRPRKMNLANYEGMCLGSTLEDGSPTLLLICDSQAGMGNRLFHLKDYVRVIVLNERQ